MEMEEGADMSSSAIVHAGTIAGAGKNKLRIPVCFGDCSRYKHGYMVAYEINCKCNCRRDRKCAFKHGCDGTCDRRYKGCSGFRCDLRGAAYMVTTCRMGTGAKENDRARERLRADLIVGESSIVTAVRYECRRGCDCRCKGCSEYWCELRPAADMITDFGMVLVQSGMSGQRERVNTDVIVREIPRVSDGVSAFLSVVSAWVSVSVLMPVLI